MQPTYWTRRLLTPAAVLLAIGVSACTPYNDGYDSAGYYGGSGYSGGGYSGGGYSGGGYYAPSYGYGYGGTTVIYGGGRGHYDGRHRDRDYRGHVDRSPDHRPDGRWQRSDGHRGDGQRGDGQRGGRDGRRQDGTDG